MSVRGAIWVVLIVGGLVVAHLFLTEAPGSAFKPEAGRAVPTAAPVSDTVSNLDVVEVAEEPMPELPTSVTPVAPPASAEMLVAGLEASLPDLFTSSPVSDEWMSSRASLRYWTLALYLGQIDELTMRRVATLIGPDDPYAGFVASQIASDLATAMPFPSEADVDRLWSNPDTRALYEEALRAKHYADIVDAASNRHANVLRSRCGGSDAEFVTARDADDLYGHLMQLRADLEAAEARWWEMLWEADASVYPHWAFLMRVARYHFN